MDKFHSSNSFSFKTMPKMKIAIYAVTFKTE